MAVNADAMLDAPKAAVHTRNGLKIMMMMVLIAKLGGKLEGC
jgi:hypothetical protein